MFKRKLLAAFALSITAAGAFAAGSADALKPYTGELPSALKFAVSKGGLTVFKKFPAEGGLDGWVVQDKASGKDIIIYSTQNGKALIAGMMLDDNGNNLSAQYTAKYVPATDYSATLAAFKAAPSVEVGNPKAKAEIVVAFDANCGYCKLLHKLITPAVEAGNLKVRYVPVAILGADSAPKAAYILASKNPAQAMTNAMEGHGESLQDADLIAKVKANTMLMKNSSFNGTPAVLYMGTKDGQKTVFVSNGVPGITEMFDRLGIDGKLDKLKQDPQLARFIQ